MSKLSPTWVEKWGGSKRIEGKRKSISGEGNGSKVRSLGTMWRKVSQVNWSGRQLRNVGFWHTEQMGTEILFRGSDRCLCFLL